LFRLLDKRFFSTFAAYKIISYINRYRQITKMKKTTFIFLFTFLNCCFAFGQFNPNSIGVCYLQQDSSDYYNLTISLPYQTLQNQNIILDSEFKVVIDTATYIGQIIIFDSIGEIARFTNDENFLIQFWCENDGGIQYRPTLQTKIKKTEFKRPLKAKSKIQNICSFVIVNQIGHKLESLNPLTNANFEICGDYNGDGDIDCFIWTAPDNAQNCDGKPDNNLTIKLRVGKQDFELRCCGP
jgi:hypothetical protein